MASNAARSETDLVALALARCKATLALGAVIPDGALQQMQHQFDELFPALAQARGNTSRFRCCKFQMGIHASGSHETWFEHWCGREGLELPIDDSHLPAASCGNWTNREVAMKNLVRLDLQFHLERISERKENPDA